MFGGRIESPYLTDDVRRMDALIRRQVRAVELYIKYGHSAADVIREPGYTNRGSLRNWFREFEERGDLHAGKVRPRSFSDGRVRAAVDHYLEHARSLARTVLAMGYPKSRATPAARVEELAPGSGAR